MLVQATDQGTHLVVPQLDISIVQGRGQQRLPRVECYSFNPVGLAFELCVAYEQLARRVSAGSQAGRAGPSPLAGLQVKRAYLSEHLHFGNLYRSMA
jgi:hypothetical protein